MLLTLPFTEPMRVETIPLTVIQGPRGGSLGFFRVIEPVDREAPVLTVPSHCARCGCIAPAAARACLSSDCPSRVAA